MKASIRLFAIAALAPVPLIGLGALFGGLWVWAALGYITLLAFSLDQLAAIAQNPAAPDAEFPAADRLSVVLALGHFALLILAILGLSGATGLGFGERFALFMGAGLFFGQISNSNAHELIHRGNRALHRLGMWVYISLLFGHHTSAHPLVHHRYVASPQDPNSARPGESFYRFAPRAWIGSFRAGYRAENARLARVERHAFWQNPYALYIGGAAGIALLVFAATGPAGLLAYIALAAYAQMQLLLSDYVQHYGLNRAEVNGKLEPVGPEHSWNARQWFTSLMMLNAPRHSDHHAHPTTPYPNLILPQGAPMLPRSLPAMATLALFPSLWRRVMDPRAKALRARQTP
ncbi:MAG: alkane 1-monooxygenase [Halocynthiibacter sp.]|jgi:alkane 1-monooxygenase